MDKGAIAVAVVIAILVVIFGSGFAVIAGLMGLIYG